MTFGAVRYEMCRVGRSLVFLYLTIELGRAPAVDAACNIVNGKTYGDCGEVRVTAGAKAQLFVRSFVREVAIINGAIVLEGGVLELSGISNGDIVVHQGGRLKVTGTVNGTVRNLGGYVEIEGILQSLYTTGGNVVVGGNVGNVSGGGLVSYKKGAVLRGVPFEKAVRKGGNQ
jgi:hypothetical protein